MPYADVLIAGAGIMGLSLALELHHRGAHVVVFDQGEALSEASTAAAGMLAAHDPENPAELLALSELSLSLYPAYIERLTQITGMMIPLHTGTTLQRLDSSHASSSHLCVVGTKTLELICPQLHHGSQPFALLVEDSLDPRELAAALLTGVRQLPITLHTRTPVRLVRSGPKGAEVHTPTEAFAARSFVDCTGAWSLSPSLPEHLRLRPRKGQMLSVEMPAELPLHLVLRTPEIYIVPRTADAARTRIVIGATVEDAGFDKTVHAKDIARLRSKAADLLPALADARELETWAGLRPAEAQVPLIGDAGIDGLLLATGHYRNGILQAPATAAVMADLLAGRQPSIDLSVFSPLRKERRT